MNVKQYQNILRRHLQRFFPTHEIRTEWSAQVDRSNLYSPRLDIAIGPFAIESRLGAEYDDLQKQHRSLIEGIISIHNENVKDQWTTHSPSDFSQVCSVNYNARCFIAIEIENKVSRKHLIGGAVNASALGRIGLFVAYTEEKFRAMKKLHAYFGFLSDVGKNSFDTKNLLIVSKSQLDDYLTTYR